MAQQHVASQRKDIWNFGQGEKRHLDKEMLHYCVTFTADLGSTNSPIKDTALPNDLTAEGGGLTPPRLQ